MNLIIEGSATPLTVNLNKPKCKGCMASWLRFYVAFSVVSFVSSVLVSTQADVCLVCSIISENGQFILVKSSGLFLCVWRFLHLRFCSFVRTLFHSCKLSQKTCSLCSVIYVLSFSLLFSLFSSGRWATYLKAPH